MTTYKSGSRPRVRVEGLPTGRDTAVLCRITKTSAYLRSRAFVGEIWVDPARVEIIRHADGTPIMETEQWPPLTPYDKGERMQPMPWVSPDPRRPEEHDFDRYGRVDFDNDESNTVATVWVSQERGRITVHILGHTEIDRVLIETQGEPEPTIEMK